MKDKIEKLEKSRFPEKLLWQWAKDGSINYKEFCELLEKLNQINSRIRL